jgi:hypothetical protein
MGDWNVSDAELQKASVELAKVEMYEQLKEKRMSERDNAIIEVHKVVFEGITIKRAVLQGSFPIPAGGGEATSLYEKVGPGVGGSAVTGVKMVYNEQGLWCEYKGQAFVIPLPNVKGCWF